MKKLLLGFVLLFFTFPVLAQHISGYVLDEKNEPIPFVNIFVQELQSGTSTDATGKYFLLLILGNYRIVVSAIGYQSEQFSIEIGDTPLTKDFVLKPSNTELQEIVVKARRRDPAFEIIQLVIENKKKFLAKMTSYKTKVYIKAAEEIDIQEKEKQNKEKVTVELAPPSDPFEEAQKVRDKEMSKINMTELQLTLNYQQPNRYKEERTAFKKYGDPTGLFLPRFSEADFNFYRNLVDLKDITNNPIISPISRTAILSYKYKLEDTLIEDGQVVYKIKVIPRKTGNSTCSGYLYVNDGHWNINRLELKMPKGGLKFYDKFQIKQRYAEVSDSLWIPDRQEFMYQTKEGKRKTFSGNTIITYSDFQPNFTFPPKFFGVEVAVTTQEAFDRDSTYWQQARPEPLTLKQQRLVQYHDSITVAHKDPAYLDSLDKEYNKVTLGEVFFHGLGFRHSQQKRQIYIASLIEHINFEVIGGFRLGPYLSYFKRWESERFMHFSGSSTLGLRNQDVQGNADLRIRYDPFRLGDLEIRGGRAFHSINNFDAYLNQLRASNYILNDRFGLSHRIELFNGFYLYNAFDWRNRQSVEGYNTTSIINEVIDEVPPLAFEGYQAFITETHFAYTPKQRYMREPNRKVVLGSDFPTFQFIHRKGWDGLFSSDINFDYLGFRVNQNVVLGTLGNSQYAMESGKFVNTEDLRLVDLKRFRQSDPVLYSHPLHSFQLLDTALVATDWFYEAHFIHHFNGAFINNLPLIKKTRISLVAGAGALWIKESGFRYEEVFAGVERIFKLGRRRRMRLGVYGVMAKSNRFGLTSDFKISFDIIDTWKRDWSY